MASYLYGTQDHGSSIVGPAVILKEVITDDGPNLAVLDWDEACSLVIELSTAREWCRMYDFIFDVAMHLAHEDNDQ